MQRVGASQIVTRQQSKPERFYIIIIASLGETLLLKQDAQRLA